MEKKKKYGVEEIFNSKHADQLLQSDNASSNFNIKNENSIFIPNNRNSQYHNNNNGRFENNNRMYGKPYNNYSDRRRDQRNDGINKTKKGPSYNRNEGGNRNFNNHFSNYYNSSIIILNKLHLVAIIEEVILTIEIMT